MLLNSITLNSNTHCSQMTFGPAHEILVLIAYAQKPTLNAHGDISSKTEYLNFWYQPSSTFIIRVHVREVKTLARLCMCTGSAEPLLLDGVYQNLV